MGCLWREQDGERECVHHVSLYTFTLRKMKATETEHAQKGLRTVSGPLLSFSPWIVISKSLGGDVVCCGSDSSAGKVQAGPYTQSRLWVERWADSQHEETAKKP